MNFEITLLKNLLTNIVKLVFIYTCQANSNYEIPVNWKRIFFLFKGLLIMFAIYFSTIAVQITEGSF